MDSHEELLSWAAGRVSRTPEVIELSDAFTTAGTGVSTDPSMNFRCDQDRCFYLSIALNPASATTSQQCIITITTIKSTIKIGQLPGTTVKYRAPSKIRSIALDSGASGGLITAWLAD